MGKKGKFEYKEFKEFNDKMKKLSKKEIDLFISACAKELAARLLAKVIKRTPVGDYTEEITVVAKRDGKKHKKGEEYIKRINPSGKKGGTLRRGWTAGKNIRASEYVNSLKVEHVGNEYVIEITNPVEYASYVENGHRPRNHKGWVTGKFMLAVSEQEIQTSTPAILERKIAKMLGECFK